MAGERAVREWSRRWVSMTALNPMHVALLTDDYCAPSVTTRGTAINTWSIMTSLLRRGHRVTTIIISNHEPERFKEVAATGASVCTVPYGDLRPYAFNSRMSAAILRPQLATFYPWVALAPAVKALLETIRPDALLGYTLYNMAATHGVTTCPRMAVLVDLDHVAAHYRWRDTSFRPLRQYFRASLRRMAHVNQPKFMKEVLADCPAVVDFAAHHALWFRRNGVPKCIYIPPPTRDPVGANWWELRDSFSTRDKFRILLIGHFAGIASISGLRSFITKILPRLEKKLGIDSFEVHVVGDHSKNPTLAAQLRGHSTVKLCGYVEDVNREFLSADVLLVPTPINLGTRTRVIEGFSYGNCVVAHRANALGIPQMVHEKNALLASDGVGLADAVIRALTDDRLRARLQSNARHTFDEHFSLESAGALLAAELERITGIGSEDHTVAAAGASLPE
jgi:glycosyltransferase involved in cell wall biosynthesis